MCGIGGILRVWPPDQRDLALRTPHDQSIPEQWLDILDDAVKHRGPDGQGRFRDRALRADGCVVDVAFVHRRLSIIDHAGGHQPMVLAVPKGALSASSGPKPTGRPIPGRLLSIEELNAHNRRILAESHAAAGTDPERALEALSSHGRIAVVFNGCIYNHRELRAELQRSGHVFSTDHSDTEVLVHGKREWGDDILGRLDGMYALCIWDSSQGSCLSARDRFGEKPMCGASISLKDSTLDVFASTAGALLRLRAALGHTRMPEPGRWPEWLTQGYASFGLAGVDEDWPCARDIWRAGEDAQTCSMFGVSHELAQGRRRTLTTSDVEALLVSAVQSRLEADVPVGCLLSGGVDSSLVASIAKHANGELRTITVRMPDARFDESSYGERVASLIGSTHTTVECDVRPADDLASLIRTIGLPFGDSSLLPTLWAHRAVGREMRVVLTGDGGDELFAGYERYRAA
ncbi:MAG TPA: asparagine synthase-related protein, partial [Phycisphaerales bacterium]|nr:asparagine synthase-related protein [Phycisphaerales bacterium]